MPVADSDLREGSSSPEPLTRLPFPPVTESNILHCSYHFWHPLYRSLTPKARLIPLSSPFLDYLRADGIILPSEDHDDESCLSDIDSRELSPSSTSTSSDSEDEFSDPSLSWLEIHQKIKSTITELGGSVMPKLNWSAPKDATWISATNSMECRTPNDIYLLLKSSDFITHDLEHAFDDCESDSASSTPSSTSGRSVSTANLTIPYHLILRKTIPSLATSLEFRCFVRARSLLCLCQRDLNHYEFLPALTSTLRPLIQRFFDEHLKSTFPDENFVFDVYVPQPYKKVWLVDMNPWAVRTDPLLFSWMELLGMDRGASTPTVTDLENVADKDREDGDSSDLDNEDNQQELPEFRLVNRDDPEAYVFNTPRYSAHKLPKDVVDASGDGEAGLREFMGRWRDVVRAQEKEDEDEDERVR
ncbi:hypothetical protein MMC12_005572 [Toensbergia leucococca]|nr:hypothetical protein [Toensbergia leucococca]